ncbi:hypothetical protein M422DRAFT_36205 [Sphaerobolus stellatus SS14]|uniref:Uncharacterized protein n=1 Tax=Sphaerobolus stellatus (strain SS14) TaxID=990650 RepID=A0A0C9V1V8_SPHS4|nr:hypothetical protein M422DRAFT_36205 [Sphaerobolus stellatus SS14]
MSCVNAHSLRIFCLLKVLFLLELYDWKLLLDIQCTYLPCLSTMLLTLTAYTVMSRMCAQVATTLTATNYSESNLIIILSAGLRYDGCARTPFVDHWEPYHAIVSFR